MTRANQRSDSAAMSEATLVRVLSAHAETLLVTALHGPAIPLRVRCALPAGTHVTPGDEVVVLPCAQGPVAIARVAANGSAAPRLADGTEIDVAGDRTRVTVRRRDGTELFHYDARAGCGSITLENEALVLAARAGDLRLQAAGEIQLEARSVRARASSPGTNESSLTLGPRQVAVRSSTLRWETEALEVVAERTQLRGRELRAMLGRAVLEVERLETVSDVVQHAARSVYSHVRELLQQRAGSLRTLVDGTAQLRAREVAHRAEDAYKIRGEKIHLG